MWARARSRFSCILHFAFFLRKVQVQKGKKNKAEVGVLGVRVVEDQAAPTIQRPTANLNRAPSSINGNK